MSVAGVLEIQLRRRMHGLARGRILQHGSEHGHRMRVDRQSATTSEKDRHCSIVMIDFGARPEAGFIKNENVSSEISR